MRDEISSSSALEIMWFTAVGRVMYSQEAKLDEMKFK